MHMYFGLDLCLMRPYVLPCYAKVIEVIEKALHLAGADLDEAALRQEGVYTVLGKQEEVRRTLVFHARNKQQIM